jgi:hypothetical protein
MFFTPKKQVIKTKIKLGLQRTESFIHSKEINNQNKKAIYRMQENIYRS